MLIRFGNTDLLVSRLCQGTAFRHLAAFEAKYGFNTDELRRRATRPIFDDTDLPVKSGPYPATHGRKKSDWVRVGTLSMASMQVRIVGDPRLERPTLTRDPQ